MPLTRAGFQIVLESILSACQVQLLSKAQFCISKSWSKRSFMLLYYSTGYLKVAVWNILEFISFWLYKFLLLCGYWLRVLLISHYIYRGNCTCPEKSPLPFWFEVITYGMVNCFLTIITSHLLIVINYPIRKKTNKVLFSIWFTVLRRLLSIDLSL